jgi:DNA-binding response OmpR family regulator
MRQRILLVDDEPQIRELLSLFLTRHEFQVTTAATSSEAISALKSFPADLVVLDIGLANEDGMDALSAIKAVYPRVKVVMLTGMGFMEDLVQEAQERGAAGYVSKVLPFDELLLELKRLIQTKEESICY